jgi:co-chaperonin GroES (HSP10)
LERGAHDEWLLIPETAKEKPQQGLVLAVGPGAFAEDSGAHRDDVKTGITLFAKYAGNEVKLVARKSKSSRKANLAIIED